MSSEPLSTRRLVAFASPALVSGALGMPLVAFLPPLYAELGLGLTAVGTIVMVARLLDVVTDPLFGLIGDRIRSRFGRRRLPMALAVPILAVGVYRAFLPGEQVAWTGLVTALVVLTAGWTMLTISHTAWASELSDDYDGRSRIMGALQAWWLIGLISVLLVGVLVDRFAVDDYRRVRAETIGWLILVVTPVLVTVALWSTPERAPPTRSRVSWRDGARSIVANRGLRRLLLVDLLFGLQGGIKGSVLVFLVPQVLALPRSESLFGLAFTLTGLGCIPIFLRLSYRLGKHRAQSLGALFFALVSGLMLFLPAGAFWWTLFVFVLIGVNLGAKSFLARSMMADVIDQDAVSVGVERNALYYSMLTLSGKTGFALGPGIVYPVLAWVGFDPKGGNDAATLEAVRWIVVLAPAFVGIVVAALMWDFPLDKTAQRRARSELLHRRQDRDERSPAS